ncbi:uncharacterized protein BXZ73DRAFT_86353 [Epithele typhae]|uniref:uncharacterized protein n=1 Tax=Epithele typhae TaxID=378194 RepID=UPI0020081BC9|nr:uncharacterized protein BXZ73DRAFT_86353 [Epithele typhae]KAH9946172.1 hypothetical protein BXZ73DRAFT_86353 [Epithele typhae]
MPSGQTCSACRCRCDGAQPMCGPCSKARKPIECMYTTATAVATAPKGDYLKKGAACAPCRSKCDAKRPYCSTCKTAEKEKECTYDESPERSFTEALFIRTHYLEQRLAAYETQVATLSHPIDGSPIASSSAAILSADDGPSHSDYQVPMYNFPQALNILFDRMAAPPPTTDIHNISTPHVPQGLEEFRTAWSEHSRQYGCILTPDKMQAIILGDISGAVVHPAFTYIAQLLGCHMWQLQRRIMVYGSVEHEQEGCLLAALEHIDPISEIQVRYQYACFLLLKGRMEEGEQQFVRAAHIVRFHNINFPIPMDPMIQSITPHQAEVIGALAHFMYLDRCSAFVFHIPMRLDKSFDDAFRTVALYFPTFAKSNLIYLRTASLLYLLRVSELTAEWSAFPADSVRGVFHANRPAWFERYWPLLEELGGHVSNLEHEMLKATFYAERELSIALKFSIVVALSAKAQMHWLLHRDHEESAQRALDVVMEVITVTRTFKDNEFLLLDPLLGVSAAASSPVVHCARAHPPYTIGVQWNTALETIDVSAKKLGYDMPFMEESLQAISDVKRFVEVP